MLDHHRATDQHHLVLDGGQQVLHQSGYCVEIIQISILVLLWQSAKERASAIHQIGSLLVQVGWNNEELLLPSQITIHGCSLLLFPHGFQETQTMTIDCISRPQERCLLIDASAHVRHQSAWDVQRVIHHQARRSTIPCGECCSYMSLTKTSVGERGPICLPNEQALVWKSGFERPVG